MLSPIHCCITITCFCRRRCHSQSANSAARSKLCSREQSLQHVLNNCEVALLKRRYNDRHDKVLACIHSFLSSHLPQAKYAELVDHCRQNGFHATLITVEVGSRGFINVYSFAELYKIVNASLTTRSALEREVIRQAIEGSFCIWCRRNWREE